MEQDADTTPDGPNAHRTDGGVDEETRRHLEACREAFPADLDRRHVGLGFDGFVDRVRRTIVERTADGDRGHAGLRELGEEIVASADADSSLVVEWTTDGKRMGGHTSHVGRAYDRLGFDVTAVGTFGRPVRDIFAEEFADQTLVSVGEPSETDAVEFGEHKLMLIDTATQQELDWDLLTDRVGIDALADHLDGAAMLGTGYWAVITSMPAIWDGLREDLLPRLDDPPEFLLFDPHDIRQLPLDDIREGADSLDGLDDAVPVTGTANSAETYHIADAFHDGDAAALSFVEAAAVAREGLGVTEFAGHAIEHSVYVGPDGRAEVVAPRTTDPVLTTSAGDHFATGLSLAKLQGIEGGPGLVLGNAVAGWFVRNGEPPTHADIEAYLDDYEWYFGGPER